MAAVSTELKPLRVVMPCQSREDDGTFRMRFDPRLNLTHTLSIGIPQMPVKLPIVSGLLLLTLDLGLPC